MPWSSQAILASIILVEGDQGGVFIYNSAGKLVDSMAFQANVDPQTKSNLAGVATYDPSTGLYTQLTGAEIFLGSSNANTRITAPGTVSSSDATTDASATFVQMISPRTASGGFSDIVLLGESKDGSVPARMDLNGGTLIRAQTNLAISTAGNGLQIKEGSNARMGTAVLVAGTVTVSNTSITSNTRIWVGMKTPGGTVGASFVSTVTIGTSFVITSTSNLDTSTVAWLLVEAA